MALDWTCANCATGIRHYEDRRYCTSCRAYVHERCVDLHAPLTRLASGDWEHWVEAT